MFFFNKRWLTCAQSMGSVFKKTSGHRETFPRYSLVSTPYVDLIIAFNRLEEKQAWTQ